jgi:hypothetical protein
MRTTNCNMLPLWYTTHDTSTGLTTNTQLQTAADQHTMIHTTTNNGKPPSAAEGFPLILARRASRLCWPAENSFPLHPAYIDNCQWCCITIPCHHHVTEVAVNAAPWLGACPVGANSTSGTCMMYCCTCRCLHCTCFILSGNSQLLLQAQPFCTCSPSSSQHTAPKHAPTLDFC